MKPANQEKLAKVYLALWHLNREAYQRFKEGKIGATMVINTSLPMKTIWGMLDQDYRNYLRHFITVQFGGIWNPIDLLEEPSKRNRGEKA